MSEFSSPSSAPTIEYWQLRTRRLILRRRPLVMGILNVTPDSFSDGGQFSNVESAVAAAERMQEDGADLIDIGGESTRPYSQSVDVQEELDRVIPVIERLTSRLSIPISIDTSKSEVARRAIDVGVEIINDVTGLQGDPAMLDAAIGSQAGVCIMHMRGTPQTMQDDPQYDCVVAEVESYLGQRLQECVSAGMAIERICLDPGIGFGKTHEHNVALLRATRRFVQLGRPLLIGHSRKGFIGRYLGDKLADRTAGTLGVSLAVAAQGAHILRVHDVKQTVHALGLFETTGGLDPA